MEKLIFHPLDEGFYAAEVPKGLFSERMIVTFGIAKTLNYMGKRNGTYFWIDSRIFLLLRLKCFDRFFQIRRFAMMIKKVQEYTFHIAL